MTLASSFMDMTGAASGRIAVEALKDETLSQGARDTIQGMVDLEQSRGHTAFHLLSLALTFDANVKLLRRKAVL